MQLLVFGTVPDISIISIYPGTITFGTRKNLTSGRDTGADSDFFFRLILHCIRINLKRNKRKIELVKNILLNSLIGPIPDISIISIIQKLSRLGHTDKLKVFSLNRCLTIDSQSLQDPVPSPPFATQVRSRERFVRFSVSISTYFASNSRNKNIRINLKKKYTQS
jgi:hypothetical protein